MEYAKAIAGAVAAGLASLVTALNDNAVTPAEWLTAALAALAALGVVWAIPNKPKVNDNFLP